MYDITIEDLSVDYELVVALSDINLKIKNKDFLAIIGPNGGGKTTLLKVLLGLLKPTEGKMTKSSKEPIGYVPQFTSFDRTFPINVFEVILTARLPKKVKIFQKYGDKDKEDVEKIMKQLGIIDLKKRQIGQLSGGQLQKVLIARALITNPGILVLDEPTASLDVQTKKEIYSILEKLNNEKTIIMVTHDVDEVYDQIDTIAYIDRTLRFYGKKELYDGKVVRNDRSVI